MAEKVTEMRLKVDLQCPCCYKKVKKILCKFPQIRDQVYDEKNNIVRIIVVCCSPEKIRDKLCCKGRKVFKSIEIVEPPPPKPPTPNPPTPKPPTPNPPTPKPPTPKPPPPNPPPPAPVSVQAFSIGVCCCQCCAGYPGGPCFEGYGRPAPQPPCYVSRCNQYFSDENPSACSIM